MSKGRNEFDTDVAWLGAAFEGLRPDLKVLGYELPEKIDFDFGFTSHGKRKGPVGEYWEGTTTSTGVPKLIIRCHTADVDQIMASLAHQVGHVVAGAGAGHGKPYRDWALRFGMEGKMREAVPGSRLAQRLHDLAESLGPFPGGALNFEKYSPDGEERRVVDVSDRQKNRQLKAMCIEHEYIVRVSAQNLRRGVPLCPVCGNPMWHEELPDETKPKPEPAPLPESDQIEFQPEEPVNGGDQ